MTRLDVASLVTPTVLQVVAPTCSQCRAMQSDIEAVADQFAATVDFVQIDANTQPDVAVAIGAMATPTLIGVVGGRTVFRHAGRRSRDELEELFAQLTTGTPATGIGRSDAVLRTGTGIALIAIGLAAPSWVLIAVGSVIAVWGAQGWRA